MSETELESEELSSFDQGMLNELSEFFNISKILNTEKPQKFLKELIFRETLIISMYDPYTIKMLLSDSELKSVGGLVIDIQLGGRHKTNFVIFVSSQLTFKKRNGGSQITSWVLPNLQTLEEKRTEFLYINERITANKQLYVAMQDKYYFVIARSKLETTLNCYTYDFEKANNLITEGSNFLLMRYLALIRFSGTFEMSTLYINGDLCQNVYYSDGPESSIINNIKCDVIRIQRIIKEQCGIVHNCITTLLLNGRIVRQEWEYCNYLLHMNPLIKLKDTNTHSNQVSVFYEWEKDMQLFSKYLDFKTKRLYLYKNYYADHPELKSLITDYCQYLLLQKPEDILNFTMEYFQGFTSEVFPYSNYLSNSFRL